MSQSRPEKPEDELDQEKRAAEKQASRERDRVRLESGLASATEIQDENNFFKGFDLGSFVIESIGGRSLPIRYRRPDWYDALPSGKPQQWCGYALGWDATGALVVVVVISPVGCRTPPPLPGNWRCGSTFQDGRSTWRLT